MTWNRNAKNEWREGFWEYVDATMPNNLRDRAHVVILPGKDGLELPLIRAIGIPERNIHCVDQSAALLATASWRKEYPDAPVYGTSLGAAVRRISASVPRDHAIRVMNLDFCTNLNADLLDQLSQVRSEIDLSRGAIVQVNVLKGREHPLVPVLLRELGYESRAEWLVHWICDRRGYAHNHSEGQYQDGPSPMQWSRAEIAGTAFSVKLRKEVVVAISGLDTWQRAPYDEKGPLEFAASRFLRHSLRDVRVDVLREVNRFLEDAGITTVDDKCFVPVGFDLEAA